MDPEITKWRFIDTGFNDPYMNMAIDEALVQLIGPEDLPIIRFFDWSLPNISIGYSQRVGREDLPIVRRPTGGGVVFHGSDVTYSIVLPRRFDLDIKDTCSLIQSWIRDGLDRLGLKTTQCREIKRGMPVYCSKSPSFGDIMIGDKKVGGLAGKRIRQKILCQGYLDISTYGINKDQVRRSIIDNWCGRLFKDSLRDEEEELANNLCENKYARDEWNYKT